AREALEETAHRFMPEYLVGIYQWRRPDGKATYLRFAFGGRLLGVEAERALDHGILRALWLTPEEIAAERDRHRSPLVMQCIRDYLAGRRFSLDLITHYEI
ncbi:MAG: NUDIX hydrolase, partial [Rhodocyclaceae bacterium]|nr:NUDIX hydrolase [Rhodocyclaceae bacterium]